MLARNAPAIEPPTLSKAIPNARRLTYTMPTATKTKPKAKDAKATAPKVGPVAAKFGDIITELKSGLPEREVEIDLLTRSIVARSHPLFIGEPGVAKSLLVRQFMSHIHDASLYEVLLAKDTPSDQVLGPLSFIGLENDEFRRVTNDLLPEANVAFLDEIFKANSTVLNALLSIINERIFHNNGQAVKVPLWTVVGASNELPGTDRDDLRAFRDRFGVTKIVDHVRTSEGLKNVLEGQLARARGLATSPGKPTTVTSAEIVGIQKEATLVEVPPNVTKALIELRSRAESENLAISARRLFEGVKLMQAAAVLSGRTEVSVEDMKVFEHVLWSDPEDHKTAYELTLDYAGAVTKKAAKMRAEFDEQQAALSELQQNMPADGSVPDSELMGNIGVVSNMLKKLTSRVDDAIEAAKEEGHETGELDQLAADIDSSRESVKKLLGIGS
jgi:MoxR-like ATPase